MPKWSIFRPTFVFSILNDLSLRTDHCDINFFADDATVHTDGKTKSEMNPNDNMMAIMRKHKMQTHYDKPTYMTLGHKIQDGASKFNIHIRDYNSQVVKQKRLVVFFDETLMWTAHID